MISWSCCTQRNSHWHRMSEQQAMEIMLDIVPILLATLETPRPCPPIPLHIICKDINNARRIIKAHGWWYVPYPIPPCIAHVKGLRVQLYGPSSNITNETQLQNGLCIYFSVSLLASCLRECSLSKKKDPANAYSLTASSVLATLGTLGWWLSVVFVVLQLRP